MRVYSAARSVENALYQLTQGINSTQVDNELAASWRPSAASPDVDSGLGVAFLSMVVSASVHALERNKLRSALTMLGVFIGVAALIAMVAVGDCASAAVKKQLESLGTNMVVVQPGASTAGGVRAGAGSASTLTVIDAQTILRNDDAVAQVGYLSHTNKTCSRAYSPPKTDFDRFPGWGAILHD